MPHPHQRVHGRLAARFSSTVGGSSHAEVAELAGGVAAGPVGGRVAEHVVRVDERDDQAERLGQLGPAEPALDLARVDLVPALPLAGVAAAEVLGLRVLARVGGLPVGEAVVALDAARRRARSSRRAASRRRPTDGSGATCPCRRPGSRARAAGVARFGDRGRELRLAPGARARAAGRRARTASAPGAAGASRAPQDVGHRRRDRRACCAGPAAGPPAVSVSSTPCSAG